MAQERFLLGIESEAEEGNVWKFPLSRDILRYALFQYIPDEAATLASVFPELDTLPEYHQAFDLALAKLLQHTAKGEAEQAGEMAELNHHLILSKSAFTEEWCGQREWKEAISPLMYAAWAGDTELMDRFLKVLPLELKQGALRQLKEVQEKGTEHGKHLAVISRLTDKYKEYYRQFYNWTLDQRDDYWVEEVGKNQLHSVVNLLQWYCSTTPFDPLPYFAQLQHRRLQVWDESVLPLTASSSLGTSFSLYKGHPWSPRSFCPARTWPRRAPMYGVHQDFLTESRRCINFLDHFCRTRTNDLAKQIFWLQAVVPVEEQPEPLEKSCCRLM